MPIGGGGGPAGQQDKTAAESSGETPEIGQIELHLEPFDMVDVGVGVTNRVDELSRCKATFSGNETRQESIASDVERNAQGQRDGMEARMIETALRLNVGVVSRAAADIGWTRQKVARRMAVLGIENSRGERRSSSSPSPDPTAR